MLISKIDLYSESSPHVKTDSQITLPNKTSWRDDSFGGDMHSENRLNGSRSVLPLEKAMDTTRKTHVRHSPAMRAYKVTAKITAVSVDHRPTTSLERPRENNARHYFVSDGIKMKFMDSYQIFQVRPESGPTTLENISKQWPCMTLRRIISEKDVKLTLLCDGSWLRKQQETRRT